MKYIRKIGSLLICIILFAAIVISLGVIFSIKNVNVTMITYADDYSESYVKAKNTLNGFKGESLVLLREDSVIEAVSDSNYEVVSCEKKFPCTLNVTIKERLETFAVFVGGNYSIYDSEGKFLRTGYENENINDGLPNVELLGVPVENITEIAQIAAMFKDKFKALRSMVVSINLLVNPDIEGYTEKLCFNLRCGIKIQLDNYTEYTEEKISAVYEEFCNLTDREKLSGTLRGWHNIATGRVYAGKDR